MDPLAVDAWNTRDPERVALAYTIDNRSRNRAEFLQGRKTVIAFLTRKWDRELDYRLIEELWFAYEWHEWRDWFRSYGHELWGFDERGLTYLGLPPSPVQRELVLLST
jgi:nuclear transport factor 2 (NTF2) superfamily protein